METKIKFSYPSSEKVYLSGKLYPEIKVGMRRVRLTPTVTFEGEKRHVEENKPVYIYDTSGPYSDPNIEIDLKKGLPKMRQSWIDGRKRDRHRCTSPSRASSRRRWSMLPSART